MEGLIPRISLYEKGELVELTGIPYLDVYCVAKDKGCSGDVISDHHTLYSQHLYAYVTGVEEHDEEEYIYRHIYPSYSTFILFSLWYS
jgi:CobQ-like glutamine amidotransferase family enzyme